MASMTDDIFPAVAADDEPPNFLFVAAARKVGIDGWQWYQSRLIGSDDFIVKGAVPRTLKSGPRKRQTTIARQPATEVVVTRADINAAAAAYEATTGKCRECGGVKGRVFRWATRDGAIVHKPCRRCGGTGEPTPPPSTTSTTP